MSKFDPDNDCWPDTCPDDRTPFPPAIEGNPDERAQIISRVRRLLGEPKPVNSSARNLYLAHVVIDDLDLESLESMRLYHDRLRSMISDPQTTKSCERWVDALGRLLEQLK